MTKPPTPKQFDYRMIANFGKEKLPTPSEKEMQQRLHDFIFNADTTGCFISTEKMDRANGLNLKIFRHCRWSEYTANESKFPTLIKQYVSSMDVPNIGFSIDVTKSPIPLTPFALSKIRSASFAKKVLEPNEYLISRQNVSIKGIPGDEIITGKNPTEREDHTFRRSLIVRMFYKQNIITLTYFVLERTLFEVKMSFDGKMKLFKNLYSKTEVL